MAALTDEMPSMPPESVSGTKLSVTACGPGDLVLLHLHQLSCGSGETDMGIRGFALTWAVRVSLPALAGLWQLVSPSCTKRCSTAGTGITKVSLWLPRTSLSMKLVSKCMVHYQQHRPLLSSEVMMPCGLQSRFVAPTLLSVCLLQDIFPLVPE